MASQNDGSIYDGGMFLSEINIPDPNKALAAILTGATGNLLGFLELQAQKGKLLFQGKVAKKTGRLGASAEAGVGMREVVKGEPRLVGHITVGGDIPVDVWHSPKNTNPGDEFFYGVLHEVGREVSDASGLHHPAHDDLVAVRDVMST